MPLPLSLLDLTPVSRLTDASDAVRTSVALAQAAESAGYHRIWYAEHHSLPGIASTAPDLMIAHVAAHTSRIRLGAGGVMLPNHAALQIAERYRLLAAMHPGRIDLGLGRAAGTDPMTAVALRGAERVHRDDFPEQLSELEAWGRDLEPLRGVRAQPTDAALPPIWLLGSSDFSARLAAARGYPFAFASHFSPAPPDGPMALYRDGFRAHPDRPAGRRAMLAVAAFVAPTVEEAEDLALPSLIAFTRLRTGRPIRPPGPEEARAWKLDPMEEQVAALIRRMQFTGTPADVAARIHAVATRTGADEVMVVTNAADRAGRIQSAELLAAAWGAEPA
ncbi:MAG: LLM class flavin-dependent oxidoreductase [Alphaproteobacteria bacterium]|nr:LLM class flavin-dependent oxidoreductase [Alphaproteobacteria bacterium]